jgi:hypothetical protein
VPFANFSFPNKKNELRVLLMEYSERSLSSADIIKIIRLVMQKEINERKIKARHKCRGQELCGF